VTDARGAPPAPASSATGSIYDLGYRTYEGPRLGRRHAIWALYIASLRSAFGIGRGGRAKIAPMSIAVLALLPALVAVGIDALVTGTIGQGFDSPIQYATYLGYTQILLILFVAAQAPELVGRDQRHRVLVLYFSRALERTDYALAKLGALTTALLIVLGLPLLVIFIGRVLGASDVVGAAVDNLRDVAPVVVVGPLAALVLGGLALAVAAMTPRRAYATVGIIALFIIPPILIAIVREVATGDLARAVVLLGPAQVLDGVNAFFFDREPSDEVVLAARLPGLAYVGMAALLAVAALGLLIRRYQRIET
jgi:ABC-2 type transport system permease protein